MISQLIAIPSVSSFNTEFDMSNRPVSTQLANWLDGIGGHVELQQLPGQRDNVNVLARFGEGPVGLALSGHTDTVPYDESRWSVDPLAGKIIDNKLFGIGSADMKGFLALCAHVIASIPSAKLKRSILLIGSADEESSMDGARHLTDIDFDMPPFCLVGEPTDLQPIRQHKGIIMERVTVTGQSGHSSDPSLGDNAIDGMFEVIKCLREYRTQLAEEFSDTSFDVPMPTLNYGRINGGDNPNRICGECSIDLDIRLMPGMTVAATRAELHARLKNLFANSTLKVSFTSLFDGADALKTSSDSKLLRACEHHSGLASGGVNFCTEGPFFSALGSETVVMGPGSIDVAHQADEFLPLDALPKMEKILHALIHQFCIEPNSTSKRS